MTLHQIIRNRLLKRAGLIQKPEKPSFESLKRSEWSDDFERLMRNRMIMGAFRYETFEEKKKTAWKYDFPTEAIKRIGKYQETGNTENLVDAANMLLIEFEFGHHKNKHFNSIDDGEHIAQKQ